MRDLILDFRRGGGSVPEVVHGIVRIWGTEVRPNATSLVVTTETTLKLSEGKATLLNAQTSGTGPLYEWAYIIQVEPFCGRNYRFYVAIPDGTGPINLVDLPKLNPITGEGFYLDIEEWEALYGDLPSRVDALETSQGTQDGKITSLEARPSGNATMRVDTSVGKRVFITDGVTEHMISGKTGWRNVGSLLINGWTTYVYAPRIKREGSVCEFRAYLRKDTATSSAFMGHIPGFGARFGNIPAQGLASGTADLRPSVARVDTPGFGVPDYRGFVQTEIFVHIIWTTTDPWPTALPGTPL